MRKGEVDESGYRYLGNFAACEPWASKMMYCNTCMTSWIGCWDNFQCPECQEGELHGYSRESDNETKNAL